MRNLDKVFVKFSMKNFIMNNQIQKFLQIYKYCTRVTKTLKKGSQWDYINFTKNLKVMGFLF